MNPALETLIHELERYRESWIGTEDRFDQTATLNRYLAFLEAQPDAAERSCRPGHLTGSALVLTPERDRVLLHLHGKLGIWIQLGGHADGSYDLAGTALREAREESGMERFRILDWSRAFDSQGSRPTCFDLDIHLIPARASEPAHEHFDARYLLIAEDPEAFRRSDESIELKWLTLEEAYRLTSETSMRRQFDKVRFLPKNL